MKNKNNEIQADIDNNNYQLAVEKMQKHLFYVTIFQFTILVLTENEQFTYAVVGSIKKMWDTAPFEYFTPEFFANINPDGHNITKYNLLTAIGADLFANSQIGDYDLNQYKVSISGEEANTDL